MNRKKISSDVSIQLGEPLPLPYKSSATSNIKSETNAQDSSAFPLLNANGGSNRRSQTLTSRDRDKAVVPSAKQIADDRLPLPKWRKIPYSLKSDHLVETEQRKSNTILDGIQGKLTQLKDNYEIDDLTKPNIYEEFEKMDRTLERIIGELEQQSIIHELEVFQQQHKDMVRGGLISRKTVFVLGAILTLVVASFFAGQFSYEYCYYFC